MKYEYIEIREGKYTTYRVKVPYYENGIRKFYTESFREKDYSSKQIALNEAKKFRDLKKLEIESLSYKGRQYSLKEIYEKMCISSGLSEETIRKYNIHFNAYIVPLIPLNKFFNDITLEEIQETLNVLKNTKSDDTIRYLVTVWRKLYDYAVRNDIVSKDLSRKMIIPKSTLPHTKKDMSFSKKQFDELCDMIANSQVVNKDRILDIVKIMFYLGLRPAEVFALQKDCIDTKNKLVCVRQSISKVNGAATISRTKTEGSYRVLPYPKELSQVFKNFKEFRRPSGELYDSRYVSTIIRNISNKKYRLYQIRHFFATDLIDKGVDLRTIQELMGHNSSAMTLSYARSNMNKFRNAIDARK